MFSSRDIIKNSGIQFGTSGARGLVDDFTPNVCAAFALAFIESIKNEFNFSTVALGIDNRPSSYVMAQACAQALSQINIEVIYCGVLPTPALAFFAMEKKIPAIMVTGSHIPFDRNGLKFYKPDGEISKQDESNILSIDAQFSELGELSDLVIESAAVDLYINRYLSIFPKNVLDGKRIGIYEHSSAGRDIYAHVFKSLGAEVISLGRTDNFVPIDTEAVSKEDQRKAINWVEKYNLDTLFSTDGDGDRPLLSDEKGQWLRGDILGLLCAKFLGIEAIAIPVSCNTAIELSNIAKKVVRTKIGSPYVIAEFDNLNNKFKTAGFEANGGFLLASDLYVKDHLLKALPTRDALLPALIVLSATTKQTSISEFVNQLPKRMTASDRLQNFSSEISKEIILSGEEDPNQLIRNLNIEDLVEKVCNVDGLRMTLSSGNIIHLRASGNAPELRCYAESETVSSAEKLVNQTLETLKNAYC